MVYPAQPGQFISAEVTEPLSVTTAAKVLGVTRLALSADMAIRIENASGLKVDTLLRLQTAYEIAEGRDREGDIKVSRGPRR